jgi:hypothetical protein
MKKERLSLNAIKNVLSRTELKKIMAGSTGNCSYCGPGGYNYCACYYLNYPTPSLEGAACGNGNCNTWCINEGQSYGVQIACP